MQLQTRRKVTAWKEIDLAGYYIRTSAAYIYNYILVTNFITGSAQYKLQREWLVKTEYIYIFGRN